MRFGSSAAEAEKEAPRGGGGDFMKYLREGDNEIQPVDEPDAWIYYWEHYNPGGYPYPCLSSDRDNCGGCQSDDEKVKKASRKIALNVFDGEYTNVWKIPKSVADALKIRYERNGTVTDRPFYVRQYKKDNGFFAYDVEGQDKRPLPDNVKEYWKDPEEMLAQAWDEAWGSSAKTKTTSSKVKQASKERELDQQINEAKVSRPKIQRSEPKREEPAEEKVVTEEELRAMEPWDLMKLCKEEGYGEPPAEVADTTDNIVDWMLKQ